jgi:hypothetical protein
MEPLAGAASLSIPLFSTQSAALPPPEDFSSTFSFFTRAQAFSFCALEPFVQPLFDYHPRPLGASRKKSFPPVLIGFFKEGPHHLFP